MKKKIILMIAVLLFGMFSNISNVFAEDTNNHGSMMIITPPREKIVLLPGETYEGSIKVSSSATATKDLKYSVYVGSFSLKKDENGETDYNYTDIDTVTGFNQIMNWITLEKEKGVVAPSSSDVIPYTIVVPKDAPAGGQYASIVVRNETYLEEQENEGLAIQNVVEFAVSIIAEVAGETRNEGYIVENKIPTILLNNNLQASSIVRNDGNVHTDASYVLQVWPMFSEEEICTNEENISTSLIMPETERYHVESCSLPRIGFYRVKQTITIFGETSIAEKTIFFCPLWLMFIILFIILAVVIYFVSKSKSRKKKD